MVIFEISLAGIAQTYLENHDATNSPHDLFAVTANMYFHWRDNTTVILQLSPTKTYARFARIFQNSNILKYIQ